MTSRFKILRRSVPNLVVAERVLKKMVSAAKHFIQDETGEAMVGLLVPGTHTNGVPTLYVLDTIAPDETAVRQFHTFQQGDERQDELIWWLQENWRIYRQKKRDKHGHHLSAKWDVPLRYLGDWHKQPGAMIQPSQGDLMTARYWIADLENGMDFLLAPIVTIGYTAAAAAEGGNNNFLAAPQGEDAYMRVDFWYIDDKHRDFLPISPALYPDEQLPELPDYPWHLVNETRFNAEYDLLEKDGLFTALVLWDSGSAPPLDICFFTARIGAEKVLLLVTPWNYPLAPPRARIAPAPEINPEDDIYAVFEEVWAQSEAVSDPKDWKWSEGRHLIDYIYAIEADLGLEVKIPVVDGVGGGAAVISDPAAPSVESANTAKTEVTVTNVPPAESAVASIKPEDDDTAESIEDDDNKDDDDKSAESAPEEKA
ncbi:MAG: hypothetical protein K8L97_31645 [Anaerolineae bacterium]|nr:hypothetical protein [Anaerolineae bacterium]